jgi:hypothetical protein
MDLGGITLGLREGVIALIVVVGAYMLFVLLRMRHLRGPSTNGQSVASRPEPLSVAKSPAEVAEEGREEVPDGLAAELLRTGLEQELDQLRDEVDAMRGELAALREDMLQELAHLRASQTASPIYGDAVQMAAAGYDPVAIAERCGIARAEAELVVALSKNQER